MKLFILFILLFLLLQFCLSKPTKIYSHAGESKHKHETKSEGETKLRDLAYNQKIIEGGKEYVAQEQYLQTNKVASRLEGINKNIDSLEKKLTNEKESYSICTNFKSITRSHSNYDKCISGTGTIKDRDLIKNYNQYESKYNELKSYKYFLHNDAGRDTIEDDKLFKSPVEKSSYINTNIKDWKTYIHSIFTTDFISEGETEDKILKKCQSIVRKQGNEYISLAEDLPYACHAVNDPCVVIDRNEKKLEGPDSIIIPSGGVYTNKCLEREKHLILNNVNLELNDKISDEHRTFNIKCINGGIVKKDDAEKCICNTGFGYKEDNKGKCEANTCKLKESSELKNKGFSTHNFNGVLKTGDEVDIHCKYAFVHNESNYKKSDKKSDNNQVVSKKNIIRCNGDGKPINEFLPTECKRGKCHYNKGDRLHHGSNVSNLDDNTVDIGKSVNYTCKDSTKENTGYHKNIYIYDGKGDEVRGDNNYRCMWRGDEKADGVNDAAKFYVFDSNNKIQIIDGTPDKNRGSLNVGFPISMSNQSKSVWWWDGLKNNLPENNLILKNPQLRPQMALWEWNDVNACAENKCKCSNGVKHDICPNDGSNKCKSCKDGYKLENNECKKCNAWESSNDARTKCLQNKCICPNGTPNSGEKCTQGPMKDGSPANMCAKCDLGYRINNDKTKCLENKCTIESLKKLAGGYSDSEIGNIINNYEAKVQKAGGRYTKGRQWNVLTGPNLSGVQGRWKNQCIGISPEYESIKLGPSGPQPYSPQMYYKLEDDPGKMYICPLAADRYGKIKDWSHKVPKKRYEIYKKWEQNMKDENSKFEGIGKRTGGHRKCKYYIYNTTAEPQWDMNKVMDDNYKQYYSCYDELDAELIKSKNNNNDKISIDDLSKIKGTRKISKEWGNAHQYEDGRITDLYNMKTYKTDPKYDFQYISKNLECKNNNGDFTYKK